MGLVFGPVLFPKLNLIYFSPFIVMAFYRLPLLYALWVAIACGLCVDLLASTPRFGLHAIAYCAASLLLYNRKQNFFADSISTLPIMTFLFSSVSTLFIALLLAVFDQGVSIQPQWILTDFILMPVADATYAFIIFTLPSILFGKPQKKGKDYFIS